MLRAHGLIHDLGLPELENNRHPGCYLNATGVNELEAKKRRRKGEKKKNDGNNTDAEETAPRFSDL